MSYVDVVVAHARARLEALVNGSAAPGQPSEAEVDAAASADAMLSEILGRFAISLEERRLLDLVVGVDRSLAAARLARSLSGTRGLSCEVLQELLGGDVKRLLAPAGGLRAHGLVTVDGVPGSTPSSTAEVLLGTGLGARLAGRAPEPGELGHGIELVSPTTESEAPSESITILVRDEVLGAQPPRWVTVGGARPGDALQAALAIARRVRRPVLLVDGEVWRDLAPAQAHALASSLRREADLRDAPLVIDGAAQLGGAWRALAVRPPPGGSIPSPIVLFGAPPAWRPATGFAPREVVFAGAVAVVTPAPAGTAATTAPAAAATPPPAAVDDGFEAVRRQAALDVAKAMGRHNPVPDKLPARAIVPRKLQSTHQRDPVTPPTTVIHPPPTEVTPPPPAEVTPPATPLPVVVTSPETTPAAVPPAAAAQATATTPPVAATPAEPVAPRAPDPTESNPYLPVPSEPSLPDLVRIAQTTTNPLQRAELLIKLSDAKDASVVALMRAYSKAEHPNVRAAAEDGMTKMFGPSWNRKAAIPKPVQPPRSDDPDRGPPGGF